jgi:hypothetical protein
LEEIYKTVLRCNWVSEDAFQSAKKIKMNIGILDINLIKAKALEHYEERRNENKDDTVADPSIISNMQRIRLEELYPRIQNSS